MLVILSLNVLPARRFVGVWVVFPKLALVVEMDGRECGTPGSVFAVLCRCPGRSPGETRQNISGVCWP